jgi:vancomycin resistance protein YoaR
MTKQHQQGTGRRARGSIYLGIAGGFLLAAGGFAVGHFVLGERGAHASAASPGSAEVKPGSAAPAPDAGGQAITKAVDALLDRDVTVMIGGTPHPMRWRELGAVVDTDDVPFAAARVAEAGASADAAALLIKAGAVPVRIEREVATRALAELKGKVDRAAVDARMDLEARTIREEEPGAGLDLYGGLAALEAAARTGAAEVTLPVVAMPARVSRASLGIDDIGHVLGTFTTRFSVSDKDRNFNLKLAASKLNGHVIAAHAAFSFNDVVGDRTEKEGYKIAHVIQAGEMVDGLAGGTCQISTTLFGASFFAGLTVDHVSNHSRPSAYVPIGFDATVVYPNTDLKLTNPYDFPIVIHYRVASGEAKVEILGKARPYDQIAFERAILEETPFESEDRPDDTLLDGTQSTDQKGFDGYKIMRYRKFYKDGQVVKTDKWQVEYKPVTEYIRKGTNTDPATKPAVEHELHGPQTPSEGSGRIVQ